MALLQTSMIGDIKTIKKEKLAWRVYMALLIFGVFGAILFAKN
jgi:hypothetical protein